MTELTPLQPAQDVFLSRFLILFTEFKDVPQETLLIYKEMAVNAVPDGRFYAETDYGRMLLMAHKLLTNKVQTVTGATLAANNITSQTVGSMSVSFDTSSNNADGGAYNLTSYGKEYFLLLKKYRPMPFCVNSRVKRV